MVRGCWSWEERAVGLGFRGGEGDAEVARA
jgi:hypothetical protein